MTDSLQIQFSQHILDELDELVKTGKPTLQTKNGELFELGRLPLSAIKIRISLDEYLKFIKSQEESVRVDFRHIVPIQGRNFQIIVNSPLTVRDEKTHLGDRSVILI